MSRIVLDASALLAVIREEKGSDVVEKYLPNVCLSAVNLSEVLGRLVDEGHLMSEWRSIINGLVREIVPFDQQQAEMTAELKKDTNRYGLSLGDRACLALGKLRRLPILTADKAWQKLTFKEPKIILLR